MYGRQMEKSLSTFNIPVMQIETIDVDQPDMNYSIFITSETDDILSAETNPQYEQFLADVWVGVILTFIVLSCVFCMCSCLLYNKFQQWKRTVLSSRNAANVENGNPECESLPSYTVASGLPSYTEALEQLRKVKELAALDTASAAMSTKQAENLDETWIPHTPPTPVPGLSVAHLFQIYRNTNINPEGIAKS